MNFANVKDWTITEGAVKQVTDSLGRVIWQKQTQPTPANDYFYVEDASGNSNTLSITNSSSDAYNIEVIKSTDQTNWESMGTTSYNTQLTATVPANSKLYLKATTARWGRSVYDYTGITVNSDYNVGGNIMSLLFGDNFQNASFTGSNFNAFTCLFNGSTYLVNAGNLVLPSNTEHSCYRRMFNYCTSLTTPPVLPATTLTDYCYCDMFESCSSLTTAPALPATTLAGYCYAGMFYHCTHLTTAPALPATTLTNRCYSGMFEYCSLLTIAPVLPATTLVQSCYQDMFYGCSALNSVTTYADDISASDCLTGWLEFVASQGDFYNYGSAVYPSGASGIPTGWTEHTS